MKRGERNNNLEVNISRKYYRKKGKKGKNKS